MIPIIFSAIAGAVANRLRGGWLKDLGFTSMTTVGRIVGAALVAAIIFWATGSLVAVAVLTSLCYVGWQWGWTKWISCIPGHISQSSYNRRFSYPKEVDSPNYESIMQWFFNDEKAYKPYVWTGMIARGLLWWVPVFVASWYMGWTSTVESIGATALLSVMFPVVYKIADKIRWWGHYLVTAELTYGALFGFVLWGVLS